eukprot:616454-Amphidinium_carterae.1
MHKCRCDLLSCRLVKVSVHSGRSIATRTASKECERNGRSRVGCAINAEIVRSSQQYDQQGPNMLISSWPQDQHCVVVTCSSDEQPKYC